MDPNGNVIHMSASRKQRDSGGEVPLATTTSHLSTQSILDEVKKAHNSDVNSIDRNRAIFHSLSTEAKKKESEYMHHFHQPQLIRQKKVDHTKGRDNARGG